MYGVDWGSTDVELEFFARDATVTTNVVGKTDVAASNVTCNYWKPGMTALGTLAMTALGSIGAAHADGGIIHLGRGRYRFCPSDTMFASVAGPNPFLAYWMSGTNMEDIHGHVPLLQPLSAATVPSDIRFINGTTAPGTGGYLDVDAKRWGGSAVAGTGTPNVNVSSIGGTAAPHTAGRLDVNVAYVGATVVPATAGVQDVRAITLGTAAATSVQTAALAAQTQYGADTYPHMTAAPNAVTPTRDGAAAWMYHRHRNRIITNATSVIQHNGSNVAISTRTLAGDTASDTANSFS